MLLTMEILNYLQHLSIQQVDNVDLGSMLITLMPIIVPKILASLVVLKNVLLQVRMYSKHIWEVNYTAMANFHHIRQYK